MHHPACSPHHPPRSNKELRKRARTAPGLVCLQRWPAEGAMPRLEDCDLCLDPPRPTPTNLSGALRIYVLSGIS